MCIFMYICVDVDECEFEELNECHEMAGCNNTFGSYDCICKAGYMGNGRNCTGTYVSHNILGHSRQKEKFSKPPAYINML